MSGETGVLERESSVSRHFGNQLSERCAGKNERNTGYVGIFQKGPV